MSTKQVGIRIKGIEAAIGLYLRPVQAHIMAALQSVYEGASMNEIASKSVVHLHSRLAEQSFFGDDDAAVKEPEECWRVLVKYADTSNSQLINLCLLSLWAKHTF